MVKLELEKHGRRVLRPELIITLAVLSAFANAALTAFLAVMLTAWLLLDPERRAKLAADPSARSLLPFAGLTLIVPVLYGNWLGLGVGALVLCFLCLLMYLSRHMTPELQGRLLPLVCWLSLPIAALACMQRFALGDERAASVFYNPNYYAAVLELVVLIALNQFLARRARREKALYLGLALLNVAALFITDCRTAWLALFVGALVLLGLNRKFGLMAALILIGVTVANLSFFLPQLFPRMDHLATDVDHRSDIWSMALHALRLNPLFGTGAFSFYHITAGQYYHAHNLLLDTLLNYGIIGCALLVAFFLPHYRRAWLGLVHTRESGNPYGLLFAATAAILVHGLTDLTILWPQTAVLFSLLVSCSAFVRDPYALPETETTVALKLHH